MSVFQIILLCVFGALLVVAVLIFAVTGLSGQKGQAPQVVMWGTLPSSNIRELLEDLNRNKDEKNILNVRYVEKDPTTLEQDFTNAVAEGTGPDLLALPQNQIIAQRNKLVPIQYTILSEREVKDTFISEGELFNTSRGYLAIPFTIDPLVMYWNRSIFQSAGISKPPAYWDEINNLTQTLTKKDQSSNILKSTIAFGEFQNVANAKEIISTLIFQAGNPITVLTTPDQPTPDKVQVVLDKNFNNANFLPAVTALDFYTQFADPAKTVFSWNRSLPLSTNAFLSGDLAIYFGFASEYQSLRDKNPNLDFDVAPLPQSRNSATKITFGNMTGLAIVRTSQNVAAGYNAARILTGNVSIALLSEIMRLPPTRRDLLATSTVQDPAQAVFYHGALQSMAWLDPNQTETNRIFRDMVESIKTGNQKTNDAVSAANTEIQNLAPFN